MELDAETVVNLFLQLCLLSLVLPKQFQQLIFFVKTVWTEDILDFIVGSQLGFEFSLPLFFVLNVFIDFCDLIPSAFNLGLLIASIDYCVLVEALL